MVFVDSLWCFFFSAQVLGKMCCGLMTGPLPPEMERDLLNSSIPCWLLKMDVRYACLYINGRCLCACDGVCGVCGCGVVGCGLFANCWVQILTAKP